MAPEAKQRAFPRQLWSHVRRARAGRGGSVGFQRDSLELPLAWTMPRCCLEGWEKEGS